jgi:hypothetical protein
VPAAHLGSDGCETGNVEPLAVRNRWSGFCRSAVLAVFLIEASCGSATLKQNDGGATGGQSGAGGDATGVGGSAGAAGTTGTAGTAGSMGGLSGSAGAGGPAGTGGSGGQAGGGATGGAGTGGHSIGGATGSGGAAGGGGAAVTCTTGQTTCPSGCANLSSDAGNCGACGHSCLGGMCSNSTCLPVTLAHLATTVRAAGLALNSSTVFTTVPGNSTVSWSLYGVPKTAVNTSPSPILTASSGNNVTGFLGANDTVVFAETGYNSPGGKSTTILSCNPTNCASTQQPWYASNGGVTTCDPAAQECFLFEAGATATSVQYAKQGMASQTSPQDFSPVLNLALGFPATAGGYLCATGNFGVNPNPTYSVVQRVLEDGSGGISTLANLGLSSQYALDYTLVVTGTRLYVAGSDINANTTGLISLSLPNGVGNSAPAYLAGTTMSSNNWIAAWGDDTAIYFANSAAQWVTCPASGCTGTPTVLTDASAALSYLVGDAQAIYWLNATSDPTSGFATGFSLMKLAR